MSGFANRTAIVTGAGAGLGRSHALGLARAGARVVVSDVDAEAARAVAVEIEREGGKAIAAAADVSNPTQVQEAVARAQAIFGGVDILVNNAGILRDRSFAKMSLEEFELVLKIHVTGSFNFSKAVWEGMREARYGRIVFTSSASGIYGNFGQANYGAAKAAMIGLMNVLHIEGEKYGIHVNTLAPTAATQMTAGLISEEAAALLAPETVTPAVLYLASENAPSRVILGAGAGVYALTRIEETEGVFLPEAERTPEGIARHFNEIASRSKARTLDGAFDQTSKFVSIAAHALNIDLSGKA